MSEKLPSTHDSAEAARRLAGETDSTTPEQHEAAVERAESTVEASSQSKESIQKNVEKIERDVAQAAPDSEQLKQSLTEPQQVEALPPPNGAQKLQSMYTYLVQVRHHLNGPNKRFSEFVHNPSINALSEAAGKTVVRPSGIMWGGLFTLIGSGWYYYATKNTGYHYNFMFALLLFVGGFFLGIIIEMMLHLFSHRRQA